MANKCENCPIRERTADGVSVGRCWFYLRDGKICPRHGLVVGAVEVYERTGKLSEDHYPWAARSLR